MTLLSNVRLKVEDFFKFSVLLRMSKLYLNEPKMWQKIVHWITSSKLRTCCVNKLFWISKQTKKNNFWAWNFHVLNWWFNKQSVVIDTYLPERTLKKIRVKSSSIYLRLLYSYWRLFSISIQIQNKKVKDYSWVVTQINSVIGHINVILVSSMRN